ncbi:MAG: hypothetical protein NTX75_02785 [Proteobacteria bacterium]|nr:hypothetical protein [Pseudomonadota bacterium]
MSYKVQQKKVKLSDIKLNPDNPRQISEKQMQYLIKSLKEFPKIMVWFCLGIVKIADKNTI